MYVANRQVEVPGKIHLYRNQVESRVERVFFHMVNIRRAVTKDASLIRFSIDKRSYRTSAQQKSYSIIDTFESVHFVADNTLLKHALVWIHV